MTLDKLPDGKSGIISTVGGGASARLRLLELGLTPGTHVTAVRRAPLGGPVQLLVRGGALTLRGEDCARIILEARE